MGDTGTHEIAEAAEACDETTRWTGSRSPASGGRAMSVDWTTTDACEQCDEHSSGEAARDLHRAWHAVVAALMEAVRIPQLAGWLARRLARTGQFCPHGTACNPYRNEREGGRS